MNVFRSQRCSLSGGLQCSYQIIRRDPMTGERINHGCCLKTGDKYNIYPEFTTDGKVINQDPNPTIPSDLKLGPTIIWENITNSHQDGLSFDFRDHPADIHPLYHKEDRNIPIKSKEEQVGEIFGDNSPVLVGTRWINESYYGNDRVEVCKQAIYGQFDNKIGIVLPKCMRSYTLQVKDWINFTNQKDTPLPKLFYIEHESKESIKEYCSKWFDSSVVDKVVECLIYVKNGGFINLWTLLENNFVQEDTRKLFINSISIKSKKNLYSGSFNLQHYYVLYDQIDKITWSNGIKFPKEIVKLYKENIVNFILNHPKLPLVKTEFDSGYKTNERYWWPMLLFKRAIKEGIINRKKKLPDWLVKQYKDTGKHDYEIHLFSEKTTWNKASKELRNEFIDAKLLRVNNPDDLYPYMEKVEDIINYHVKDSAWYIFCDILKAGRRWNKTEIKNAWDVFLNAYSLDEPSIFWNWIEEIADKSVNNTYTEDGYKLLEEGLKNLVEDDEGEITSSRSFALNLIGLRTGYSEDSWEVDKLPVQNWFEVSGKTKPGSKRNPKDIFWNELAKCGGLEDDRFFREGFMSIDDYDEATYINPSTYGFADNDFESLSIYDSNSDETTQLREEDPWQDEE